MTPILTSDHIMQQLRRLLHQHPELSNAEHNTATLIKEHLIQYAPDQVYEQLGVTGIAFEFASSPYVEGPTTLIRSELDALPIQEINTFEHRSINDGVSHKCGHDGHMAIVCKVAEQLSQQRPNRGRVVLLFQPAEETGEGAQAVVESAAFKQIKPDYAFALHNLPGAPLGEVRIKSGLFNFASAGLTIELQGKESHAAHPEDGISPAVAMCELISQLNALPSLVDSESYVTIVSAKLGEPGFGTAPGHATIMATLRSTSNQSMAQLASLAEELVETVTRNHQLDHSIDWSDQFSTCFNTTAATSLVVSACESIDQPLQMLEAPYRWSEDFGKLLEAAEEGAMFTLGAGESSPQLHNPDYDFDDRLIEIGARLFLSILRNIH